MTSREAVGPAPASERAAGRTSTIALAAIAGVGIVGFAILTWLVAARIAIPFDAPLRDIALRWSGYDALWGAISDAANLPLIAIGVGIVAWLLLKRRFREAIIVIVILAAVTAGSEGVKQLVHRPRPPSSNAQVLGVVYSYPSGHTLEALTILGTIAVLVWRSAVAQALRVAVAVAVGVFVLLVAVARVAIDAHYPSDVLAGFLAGGAALAIFILLTRSRSVSRSSAGPDRS